MNYNDIYKYYIVTCATTGILYGTYKGIKSLENNPVKKIGIVASEIVDNCTSGLIFGIFAPITFPIAMAKSMEFLYAKINF